MLAARRSPPAVVVDRGYRGHGVETARVSIGGARWGIAPALASLLRRRSAIEPEIGHMKTDGRLTRRPLKETTGDALFAVLCACGHDIRKTLAHLRTLSAFPIAAIIAAPRPQSPRPTGAAAIGADCSG